MEHESLSDLVSKMDKLPHLDPMKLDSFQWRVRSAVRAFLLTATPAQLERELEISLDNNDLMRATFIRELINES